MANHKKPSKLKIVQGTARKDRTVDQEPKYKPPVDIDPPADLEGLALEQWQHKAPLLLEAGVLTEADLEALRGYCLAYQNMVELNQQVQIEGAVITQPSGVLVKNPAYSAYIQASQEIRQYSGLLGLDPASRSRINIGNKKPNSNPFADL